MFEGKLGGGGHVVFFRLLKNHWPYPNKQKQMAPSYGSSSYFKVLKMCIIMYFRRSLQMSKVESHGGRGFSTMNVIRHQNYMYP